MAIGYTITLVLHLDLAFALAVILLVPMHWRSSLIRHFAREWTESVRSVSDVVSVRESSDDSD